MKSKDLGNPSLTNQDLGWEASGGAGSLGCKQSRGTWGGEGAPKHYEQWTV